MIKLPTPGHTKGYATGLNDQNEIVGVLYSEYSPYPIPVLWRLTTKVEQPLSNSPSDGKASAPKDQGVKSEARAAAVETNMKMSAPTTRFTR